MKFSFDDVAIFTIAAEKGSFLEASKVLDVSHVTVSRSIQKLEDKLNRKLLIRTNSGVKPTSYGLELLEQLKPNISNLNEILTLANSDSFKLENENKTIKLLMSSGMSFFFIEAIYDELKNKFNDLSIEISTYTSDYMSNNVNSIRNYLDQFDLIFIEDYYQYLINDDNWKFVNSRSGYLRFFASEKYINKNGKPQTLEDLSTQNSIYYNLSNKQYLDVFDSQGKVIKVNSSSNFSSDTFEHIYLMVLKGYGIGLLPDFFINNSLPEHEKVKHVLEDYKSSSCEQVLLKSIHSNNKCLKQVADQIKQILQSFENVY